MEYLIIGSGIAGYNALKELINVDPNSKITLVSNDKYYPYDRPPLSKYYLRGEMGRDKLFFESESFYKRENLKVVLGKSVESIGKNEAVLDDGTAVRFDKALIATGGRPRKLGLPGEGLKGVHYLRTLDDCDSIKAEISKGKEAVIIGGGFIGMEVASSLTMLGVKARVIEVKPYIWNTFVDEKVSKFIQQYFEKKGVEFLLNEGVKEIQGEGRVSNVLTNSGKRLGADIVLIAVGIVPNVELAQKSGISVNNGIVVDERLETSMGGVYAAGDVANIYDPVEGRRKRIEHWNNADYTGKLAARNMAGKNEVYNFVSSVWSDIFDLHIESAGDTAGYDEYVIRGKFNLDNPSFNVIYLKGGTVKGYLAVNRDFSELEVLNKLIEKKVEISGMKDKLTDEGYDLKGLIKE
ncbi:NAD(P)/FAD-dependent oxidoreductase [Stygiolobus caldivivus]|uniref:NADH oxidase n=1 Tax=Stygiolobus caldivivus TaxID=2824673 RepID=A0A8D5ZJ06_9CREN|nr:FAD/NAD(P)-binding oxidoreductase [Stygiolobus caldivivus]BCU70111.1 NADH oxidase [Stygiolobus caldivivus]